MANAIAELREVGTAIWLDDLSRSQIVSGSLSEMVERGDIAGITTNPTIFARAIGAGSGYEDQVRDLTLRGTSMGETLRLLTAWDVRAACDILRGFQGNKSALEWTCSVRRGTVSENGRIRPIHGGFAPIMVVASTRGAALTCEVPVMRPPVSILARLALTARIARCGRPLIVFRRSKTISGKIIEIRARWVRTVRPALQRFEYEPYPALRSSRFK